jgi:hypothetical protein
MQIQEIIKLLANTPSTNGKLAILNEHKNNELLQKYIYLTLSPRVRYFLTSKQVQPLLNLSYVREPLDFQEALNKLEIVRNREITGHDARDFVVNVVNNVHPEQVQLFLNLLDSDLRCGVNYSSVNKVWDDLIKYPEVQLSHTDITRIKFPAISQLKADGVRVVYEDGIFQTRNGSIVEVHSAFDELHELNVRLDGEFVCFKNGTMLDRKTSNGIINKAIKGTISEEEASWIVYQVWDLIQDVKTPYAERFDNLEAFVKTNALSNIKLIESKLVNDVDEAMIHFKELRSQGFEGTIVKNVDAEFENKRSYNLCKMKAEHEADLKVTGYEIGTGKNADRIGNLLLESECGKVKLSCGIFKDFPEEVRDEWLVNLPKIVTVRYNERITAKGRDTESLFLPRVIAVRDDKDEADTLEKMISEESAVSGG